MSNTLWLTNAMSSCKDDTEQRFKVTIYFPCESMPEKYDHVIDIAFNDGVIVLVLEDRCVYYRAKHVKKWTALKEV